MTYDYVSSVLVTVSAGGILLFSHTVSCSHLLQCMTPLKNDYCLKRCSICCPFSFTRNSFQYFLFGPSFLLRFLIRIFSFALILSMSQLDVQCMTSYTKYIISGVFNSTCSVKRLLHPNLVKPHWHVLI